MCSSSWGLPGLTAGVSFLWDAPLSYCPTFPGPKSPTLLPLLLMLTPFRTWAPPSAHLNLLP